MADRIQLPQRPTALTEASAMADAEVRMGLEPIECLIDERNALVEELAELRAKYGSFGVWDHIRKVELSQLKIRVRAEWAKAGGGKLTNEVADEMAHAHPEYIELITQALRDRARWVKLEERLAAIDFKINRGQSVARFVTAEISRG